jgi:FMNH2-dependent dimethyl sulfone monooxygenase
LMNDYADLVPPSREPFATANSFKLAVFGTNVSGGCSMTGAPGTIQVEWAETLRIAHAAERAGFEAIIPVARWKGFGGDTNFNHRTFETYTWAAGLAQATSTIRVFATSHVPTVHPVLAAKQATTIDHISGGRFGLNIVAGWNAPEIAMFGTVQREHDTRYECADEWIGLIKKLWTTEGAFDFNGHFFQAPQAYLEPKPIQKPYPIIMSAGLSPAGRRFGARHADIIFILTPTLDDARQAAAETRALARREFGRDIKVFGMGYVVCADTEREAREYLHYYVHEKGDWPGMRNWLDMIIPNSGTASKEGFEEMCANMIAGYCGLPLVGTPEQIVEGMLAMHKAGLDGITLSWVDYEAGIAQFSERIEPLMRQADLRREVPAAASS